MALCCILSKRQVTGEEKLDYFIDNVIDTYLVTAIHHLRRSQQKKMKALVALAKEKWKTQRVTAG
jgi:hypothetical protein